MLGTLLVVLIILWILGFIHIEGLVIKDITLFVFNGRSISLWDVLVFTIVLWAIGILPSPLRQIVGILFILWVLSVLGILSIFGLSNLLVLAIIIGLGLALINH